MGTRRPSSLRLGSEDGSAVAEFAMVTFLLTVLVLAVIQLGLGLLVRNTVLDGAAEGARFASLADRGLVDGERRARELITAAIGARYAVDVRASYAEHLGDRSVVVTVRSPLPVIGLIGIDRALEVSGHASVERLEE
jgi:Flp pilus assembly protein TadG